MFARFFSGTLSFYRVYAAMAIWGNKIAEICNLNTKQFVDHSLGGTRQYYGSFPRMFGKDQFRSLEFVVGSLSHQNHFTLFRLFLSAVGHCLARWRSCPSLGGGVFNKCLCFAYSQPRHWESFSIKQQQHSLVACPFVSLTQFQQEYFVRDLKLTNSQKMYLHFSYLKFRLYNIELYQA